MSRRPSNIFDFLQVKCPAAAATTPFTATAQLVFHDALNTRGWSTFCLPPTFSSLASCYSTSSLPSSGKSHVYLTTFVWWWNKSIHWSPSPEITVKMAGCVRAIRRSANVKTVEARDITSVTWHSRWCISTIGMMHRSMTVNQIVHQIHDSHFRYQNTFVACDLTSRITFVSLMNVCYYWPVRLNRHVWIQSTCRSFANRWIRAVIRSTTYKKSARRRGASTATVWPKNTTTSRH